MHEHLFDAGGGSLVAAVEDVVEQRAAPDRAFVGLFAHLRQLEPVVEVRVQRGRIVVGRDPEEVALVLGNEYSETLP